MIKKVIAIFPGRFQPFCKHHAATFMWLQKQFGTNNTFIVTSDKVVRPKSPLNFKEKEAIIDMYKLGSKVIKVTNPYKPVELLNKFDPKTTAVVFMVGKKDMEEDPRFSMKPKADGSPSYFQPYEKNKSNLEGFDKHGYLIIAPHISLNVPGYGEMSGTQVRKALGDKMRTATQKKAIFQSIFGWYSPTLANYVINKFSNLEEDKIPGGLAANKTLQDVAKHHDCDIEMLSMQLTKGINIELEHTTDQDIAQEIALDHLWEDPQYYTKLVHVEEAVLTKPWWDAVLTESLVDHAQNELELAGLFDKDADYGGMIGKAVLDLMKTFADQGHSGMSAMWVRDLFNKLGNYENLTPITSDPKEWEDVTAAGIGTSNGTLWQNRRNPAIFSIDKGNSWYNVNDTQLKDGLLIVLNKMKYLHYITEGGAAGHMAHIFDIEWVKTGDDIITAFNKCVDYLEKGTGALKIDGVNASVRLVTVDGKKQFVLDRGSNKELDVKGVTKADLLNRFGDGHGMIIIGTKVLDVFNQAIPKIQTELKSLGLWDNPNIMFNVEYVSGQTNVLQYEKNFIAIHGLLELVQATPTRRVTKEISYSKKTLATLVQKMAPVADINKFKIYGVIPTTLEHKANFTEALNKKYTINLTVDKAVTRSLQKLLSNLDIPKNQVIDWNGKKVSPVSKEVFTSILKGVPIMDNTKQVKLAVAGFVTYLATMELGDAVLKSLTSPLGQVENQEGVVIRDKSISGKPVKITGKFILKGLASSFQK